MLSPMINNIVIIGVDMRLHELTETFEKSYTGNPDILMKKIVDDIGVGGRNDCHGTCARAISNGVVNDDDIVVIMGPVDKDLGFHSIIISPEREIKVDAFGNKIVNVDKETMTIEYKLGDPSMSIMNPKRMATVAALKKHASA